jgi:hypothetical protein
MNQHSYPHQGDILSITNTKLANNLVFEMLKITPTEAMGGKMES